ncbi:uncharacterized protein CLAFUR5_02239 [Fulvia fulva]|uniref:Uncharacterized protein n=1 Tax=Passalora fulva TaxID=5499 RepID=A0A9Q8L5I0_PASFU|nr:uncharacterized protein CLAFUR5_02239 [Fulvia fulva]KAK4636651.1 hypothetical protein CLAFUR0_02247 [Fulvia fulva]UJO11201.1 hypothetical protein CLAFUR5_02239 [Fulvia fulva]
MIESARRFCIEILEAVLHLTLAMTDPIGVILAQKLQNSILLNRLAKFTGISRKELQRPKRPSVAIPSVESPAAQTKPSAESLFRTPTSPEGKEYGFGNEFEADGNEPAREYQDPQSLRDEKYCVFDGEAEDDYTQGPARLVMAFDGVQDCPALLMRMDLSQLIQHAAYTRRLLGKKRHFAERQGDEIDEFEYTVRDEISSHKIRLAELTEVFPGEEPKETDPEVLASIQRQIDVLEGVLERMSAKKARLHDGIRGLEMSLAETQDDILSFLAEALQDATLIPEQDEEEDLSVEQFDLQAEYQATAKEMSDDQDPDAPPEPLETGDGFLRPNLPTPTHEEQAIAAHRDAVREAREFLNTAQAQFNRKEYDQECDKNENLAAYTTWTEFDNHWVQRYREITNELVEAEEAYKQAKASAIEAGIPKENVLSEYDPRPDHDGYPLSEDVGQDRVDARRYIVDDWMEKVPDDAEPDFQDEVDVDDWDGEEIDISDSISCVDRYMYRAQIDEWRQQALSTR